MFSRFARSLCLILLCLLTACTQVEQSALGPGITYTRITNYFPRTTVAHIVAVDLTNPYLKISITPPLADSAHPSRDTQRQTTLDFLHHEHALVAINANFFVPFPSTDPTANVVGLAASNGTIYSPFEPQPVPGESTFPNQSFAIVPFAPAINFDADHHAQIVHDDPTFPDQKHTRESITPYNAISGSAQIITDGQPTIPTYAPDQLSPSKTYSAAHSWYDQRNARSAIGLSQDKQTLILCVIEKSPSSAGLTVPELADFLLTLDVYNALNLDGGGSSSLALQDPSIHFYHLANISSDNPHGRAVGNNLAIGFDSYLQK